MQAPAQFYKAWLASGTTKAPVQNQMVQNRFPVQPSRFPPLHTATSPDGKFRAKVKDAFEVAVSDPASGTLTLSTGLTIEKCNPGFIWSDDSKWLAVPQWHYRFGLLLGQHILVVEAATGKVCRSPWYRTVLQPERFAGGRLTVLWRPAYNPKTLEQRIPEDLKDFV